MSVGVFFNGNDLSEYFYIGHPIRPLPDYQPQTAEVSGRRGSLFRRAEMGSVSVTVPLAAKTGGGRTPRECFEWLVRILDVEEPAPLAFTDEEGYRLAIPSGSFTPEDDEFVGTVDVTFLQPDPARYGYYYSTGVSGGSTTGFTVGGNTRTYPIISGTTGTPAGADWVLRLDNRYELRMPDTGASESITCDCGQRLLIVGGDVVLPSLTSDWLFFEPGVHSLHLESGSGDITVKWQERWL